MYDFQTDAGDACWYVALSNLTGIDVDLWAFDIDNVPGCSINYRNDSQSDKARHLASAELTDSAVFDTLVWKRLMSSLGYDITWRSTRPAGEFILMMMIAHPKVGTFWDGHAVAVDASGIIHESGALLDGESVDAILNGGWCNIILPSTPFITVRERS